ncbi:uncharacterized protein [Parasteatoda tepidariorum]|uniref:uncharacterized protein n=1 Tax=Parasteatoda tepidariorum TaxID=114398 RepID=UPI0039BCED02
MTSDKYAAMLFPLVESCIPEEILRVWLRSYSTTKVQENTYCEKLKQLLLFLRNEGEGEQRISLVRTGFKFIAAGTKKEKKTETDIFIPTAIELFSGSKSSRTVVDKRCVFCDKNQESKDCFTAAKLAYHQKQELIKNKKACFICLKFGHKAKYCKSSVKCLICAKRHWSIMCAELSPNKHEVKDEKVIDSSECQNVILANSCCSGEIFLQTLMVNIESKEGKRAIRALIDTGSQRSYILKSTVEELKFRQIDTQTLIHSLFGGSKSSSEIHNLFSIKVTDLKNSYSCNMYVLDQHKICSFVPRLHDGPWMQEMVLKGISLSDIGNHRQPIELLIGADEAGKLYNGKVCNLACGLTAVETYLGWVIMGKMKPSVIDANLSNVLISLLTQTTDIENLWKLEAIGITDACEIKDQREIEDTVQVHFERTVKLNSEGRYEIYLPWIKEANILPDNRKVAEKRLLSTTTKLNEANKFFDYNAIFENWCKEGVIEEVPEQLKGNSAHYLPHRAVFKNSLTTPVRPVFDASAKQKGSFSLNDCLAKGPNLLELIPVIILKFRENSIGVISDIKGAFLQISVNDKDRDYLRFLWWKDDNKTEIKLFRHCRVVFGVNCSPFLLGAVIKFHLRQFDSEIAEKLLYSFYVDNCVTSADTEEELRNFINKSTEIMGKGKFDLRCWEHTKIHNDEDEEKEEVTKVLGLLWNKREDSLFCDVPKMKMKDMPITRRTVLSVAQRMFDPIGFSCPVTLIPKLILQKSWQEKLSWDTRLTEDLKKEFLVKSRVSPLRKITIPRLELLACYIGAKLSEFVTKSLTLEINETYYWTDSTTALFWIKKNDLPWGTFVCNRVKKIRECSDPKDWRHVPGISNPADLPSRGCTVSKLLETKWWEGPLWLSKSKEEWPNSTPIENEEEIYLEQRKTVVATLTCENTENSWMLAYFSSYLKILRMTAWILRFLKNAQKTRTEREIGELKLYELNEAEKILLKQIQQKSFNDEDIARLKSLCVFKDEEGILRTMFLTARLLSAPSFNLEHLPSKFSIAIRLQNLQTLLSRLLEDSNLCTSIDATTTTTREKGRYTS